MANPAASSMLTSSGRRLAIPRALRSVVAVLALTGVVLTSCGVKSFSAPPQVSSPSAPSATPTPPLRPMATIAQAWGAGAAAAVLTTQVDSSHSMGFFSLSPDGRSLYGDEVTLVNGTPTPAEPAQAGLLDIASRQFTPIGVASSAKCFGNFCPPGPPLFYLHCCQTDGRFLIALSTGYPGPDCGGCLWSYDQQTGTRYEVATGNQYQGIDTTLVDHGVLVFSTGTGILVADLAARTLTALPGTTGGTQLDAFSWPYIVYGSPPSAQQTTVTPTPLRVYDLANGVTTLLPQVTGTILDLAGDALYYTAPGGSSAGTASLDELDHLAQAGAQPRVLATLPAGPGTSGPQTLAITDDTLFYAVTTGLPEEGGCLPGFGVICPTPIPAPAPVTTLYAVDRRSSSANAHAIAAYAANLGNVLAANTRLVVLYAAAWDRAEGRFVALESLSALASNTAGVREDASGNFLLLAQEPSQSDASIFHVAIYDAAHLPLLTS